MKGDDIRNKLELRVCIKVQIVKETGVVSCKSEAVHLEMVHLAAMESSGKQR
jgi:hypothetical protein